MVLREDDEAFGSLPKRRKNCLSLLPRSSVEISCPVSNSLSGYAEPVESSISNQGLSPGPCQNRRGGTLVDTKSTISARCNPVRCRRDGSGVVHATWCWCASASWARQGRAARESHPGALRYLLSRASQLLDLLAFWQPVARDVRGCDAEPGGAEDTLCSVVSLCEQRFRTPLTSLVRYLKCPARQYQPGSPPSLDGSWLLLRRADLPNDPPRTSRAKS